LQGFDHGKGSPGAGAKPDPMSEPRVQRTLVKSPPELWAEISDVSTLARHLGEFGEIRITRLENETTVVWEGDRACGTVELEASGWGTKVTITAAAVEAQAPEPEPAAVVEAQPEAVAEVEREPEVVAEVEPEPEAVAVVEPEAEPEPVAAAEPEPEHELGQVTESLAALELAQEPAPTPKRRLLARLFRRRAAEARAVAPQATAEPAAIAEPEPVEPEPVAIAEPEPEPVPTVEPEPVATVEPDPEPVATVEPDPEPVATVEPDPEPEATPPAPVLDDERLEAVLVGVLDDLGSAHHRPFSRG
jgi:hypothetical protein